MRTRAGRLVTAADRAAGGFALDLGLYALSALFAALTAATTTLSAHRAWGGIAVVGYGLAAVTVIAQSLAGGRWASPSARLGLAGITWVTTAVTPLVVLAMSRAAGAVGKAQEEVPVVEDAAWRLLHAGTPYLDRATIAGLPASDRLLGYVPYQPGMALFGIPRAVFGDAVWTDARVWFGVTTAAAVIAGLVMLRRIGAAPRQLIRAVQVIAVLPLSTLTLATGGDDLPVLGLSLLAFVFMARASADRSRLSATSSTSSVAAVTTAGVVIGLAAALKLFAWPIAVVLGFHVAVYGRQALVRYAAGAAGIPLLSLLSAVLINPAAVIENLVAFPAGRGVVTSPAQSPLPGHLIAVAIPGGRAIVSVLIVMAAAAIVTTMVWRPPTTVAAAMTMSGWGLSAAIMLMPTTRFGYMLYPVVLLTWAAALSVVLRPVASQDSTARPDPVIRQRSAPRMHASAS